jgi:hypothetical protein
MKGFATKIIKYLINILKHIIVFAILINIISFLVFILYHYCNMNLFTYAIPSGEVNNNLPMDPVRWWPSGIPQSSAIVGTALLTFYSLGKMGNVSPRFRVLGALGAAGVAVTQITYHSAIENSVGFNRFAWSLSEARQTGRWPSVDQISQISKDQLDKFVQAEISKADSSKVNSILNEISKINKGNNNTEFVSSNVNGVDLSDLIVKLSDFMFKETMQLINPIYVQGFFDDLIGQRIFIEVILFILVISIILLFIFFILNIIFILNKDRIINKFNNRFITFYIKYQSFLSKLALIYTPILIFIGLITLCHGLHWLLTNQIPYHSLGIDLHKFIS